MPLPDNPAPDDLTLKSKPGEPPIYMHLPTFKFVTLMHDGEPNGRSGGQTGRVEWHDSYAQAASYLRGVSDAQEACDYTLTAVIKENYVHGEGDEETDEELLAQVDADEALDTADAPESEDTLEGGLPDRDEKHPNQCLECQQWFSDEAYVRYFDKCRGCAESLPG